MTIPPLPPDEPQRLQTLQRLGLLDTPIEERFERITRMVCRLLDVPVASFTLVDEKRQWFKSVQGNPDIETPRDIAFCAHTINQPDTFVVPDARTDDRFSDNPLVKGMPYIVFYAGHPVKAADGSAIGTLCAIDTRARSFSPEQFQLLREMASMIESEIRVLAVPGVQSRLMRDLNAKEKHRLIDPVTRVWNRAGAMTIMDHEWDDAIAQNVTVGVMLAEIDGFNDGADNMLKRITASRFLSVLPAHDVCAHIGDNKFLVLLPGCLADQLPEIGHRMLAALRSEPIMICGRDAHVTASIGAVTAIPAHGDTIDSVMAEAEHALQHARDNGGDCLHIGVLATPMAVPEHRGPSQMSL